MNVSSFLPAKVRRAVYVVLGAALAIEQIWDFLPPVLEGKWLATLSALGFGLAATQTSDG